MKQRRQAERDRDELRSRVAALSAALGGDAAVADRAGLALAWVKLARGTGYLPRDGWRAIERLASEVADVQP